MSGLLLINEIQKQSHTTLRHLIVLSVFHSADSDITVSLVTLFVTLSLVVPFVWLPSLGRKFEIILAALSTMIFWVPALKSLTVSLFSSNSAAGVAHPMFFTKLWMLSLKAVYVKNLLSTCKRSWHTSFVFTTLLRIAMWQFWHFIVSCCNWEWSSFLLHKIQQLYSFWLPRPYTLQLSYVLEFEATSNLHSWCLRFLWSL